MGQAYQPLHHKYRPQRLDQLVGQEAIAATLTNALRSGRIAPAYLFCGPRGTGKTSSARILARSLNCSSSDGPTAEPCGTCELCRTIAAGTALDVIEIDAASNTGVDNIRELIERSRFAPVQARWKVYVVDECHMLSTAAFNALLKTLEEPPPRVVFVLATTDPQRVLPTILSRCQRFDFRRIPLEALEGHLRWIADQEQIGITADALHLVAQRAQGGLRDAESLLDQLSLLPAPIEAGAVWDLLGAVPEEELLALASAMASGDPLAVVEHCRALLERGREPTAVLQGLASLLRDLLLAGVAPDRLELTSVAPPLRPQLPEVARGIGKARLLRWQADLKGSEQQLRQSVQPRLWLEVLVLGLLAEPVAAVSTVVANPSRPQAAGAGVPSPSIQGHPPSPLPPTAPAAAAPAPAAAPAAPAAGEPAATGGAISSDGQGGQGSNQGDRDHLPLPELWQQILAGLELPSTRMLLSQQAQLVRLDDQRAVVRVANTWMGMVQSRQPLLEKAIARALGSARQLVLEPGGDGQGGAAATPLPTNPSPSPAPAAGPARTGVVAARTNPLPPPPAVRASAPPQAAPPPQPPAAPAPPSPAPQAPAPRPAALEDATPAPTPTTPVAPPATSSPATGGANPASAAGAAGLEGGGASSGHLDEKARRLADFFNGEVVQDLEDLEPEAQAPQALPTVA